MKKIVFNHVVEYNNEPYCLDFILTIIDDQPLIDVLKVHLYDIDMTLSWDDYLGRLYSECITEDEKIFQEMVAAGYDGEDVEDEYDIDENERDLLGYPENTYHLCQIKRQPKPLIDFKTQNPNLN